MTYLFGREGQERPPKGPGQSNVFAVGAVSVHLHSTLYLFAKAEGSYPSPGLAVLFSRVVF